ncbi:CynX/NimT family MFS transporter [Shimwellia pseudoproteus]|uniref:MFS transporter n=1 Tax=Shimwellia pseudoproteus TaxID=570012 RepID=UPI0018EAF0BB|nr:MFS transporter [Shimwellia pseudoproteus]MBJ3813931.1 CynX/NimT family MFS transporter [Shimwellia pseudoproteus]
MPTTTRSPGLFLLPGILLIAATLRVTFTAIAPLLDELRHDYGLTTAQTGILTTLPLITFALISPLAAGISRRLGTERSLFLAMLLICGGIGLRSAGSLPLLYVGTAVIGCGIALGNVLLPALIKQRFADQVARLTGRYSLTMGVAAALGSLLIVPIAQAGLGWRGAFLALIIFPLAALLVWLPQLPQQASNGVGRSSALSQRQIWRTPLAWQVTFFLGLNSLIYYVVIAWLPAILVNYGYSTAEAGSLHGLLQLATAAPGLVIGLVISRLKDQRGIALLVGLLGVISLLGLWLSPGLASLWIVLYGFSSGATMILGLVFIGLRASSAHQAAALSGMAQSVGYLLAAFGPPLMGRLHDITHSWALALMVCALLSALMALSGMLAGRDRVIDLPQPAQP